MHGKELSCVRWLGPAASEFAAGSLDRSILLFSASGAAQGSAVPVDGRVNDMAVTADWKRVVAVLSDRKIAVLTVNPRASAGSARLIAASVRMRGAAWKVAARGPST